MKLHREQFLAAAMMLSAAQNLAACRSKPDGGNEGINPEETQTIGQNGPNGSLGQDLGASPNRALQPVGAKAIVPTREVTGVAVPVQEQPFVAAPVRETGGIVIPNREAPAVTTPVREVPFVPPRTTATTPAIKVTPRK